jgi:hypothetical protein
VPDESTMQSRRRDHTYTRPRAATLEMHALPKLRWCRAVEDVFSCSDAGEYGMMLSMIRVIDASLLRIHGCDIAPAIDYCYLQPSMWLC